MMTSDDLQVEAAIRGQQIHAMESNVWKSLAGYLVLVGLTVFVVYGQGAPVFNWWVPLVFVVCGVRIAVALRTARGAVVPLGPGRERLLMLATSVVSATMASGPVWLALHSEGFVAAAMILLVASAMWGGALVQAPVFSSAASYTAMTIPVWVLCLVGAGPTMARVTLTLMFAITALIAIDNLLRYARNFERGLRQQMDVAQQSARLKQQADVIALLLKEHEDQSSDWLWQTDASGRIVNPSARFIEAFSDALPPREGDLIDDLFNARATDGTPAALGTLRALLAGTETFREVEVPGRVDGAPRWWTVAGRPIFDDTGALTGFCGVMADVTTARQAQAQVTHLAHHDPLTGLVNRAYFRQRLEAALVCAHESAVGLLSIDLDGFKPVNDRYGHPVGDALLVELAQRLRAAVGSSGTAARIGGDEFAIAINIGDPAPMEEFCTRLVQTLIQPYRVAGHDVTIGVSVGVAFAPRDGQTIEVLSRNADAALYRAKRDGKGNYRFYAPHMDHQMQERMLLQQDLRDALGQNQFVLNYQPFIASDTGAVTGCEALIRWHHPTRGLVAPLDFIGLAEESGLIISIGAWVIESACMEAASWPGDTRVAVNISPRQFSDRELPNRIRAALARAGLAAHRLEIEITEAVLINDAQVALDILERIRAIGVRIALDDFGTGYSSLSYLSNFPFDKLKIDRSFVAGIETMRDSRVIVQGINSIALGLGMTIIAEGVETAGQAEQLKRLGCHELQGYLFSKPVPQARVAGLFHLPHGNEYASGTQAQATSAREP